MIRPACAQKHSAMPPASCVPLVGAPIRGARWNARRQAQRCHAKSLACGPVASLSVGELNDKFGIKGSVRFEQNDAGLTKAVLTHDNGGSSEVYLFGAHVTSWCQPSGDEVLFLRPDAKFDGSRPIAGGIPICFPQFGLGTIPGLQQHGFARNMPWEVINSSADVNPDYPEPCVMLQLVDSEATRKLWPHAFGATLEVTLRRDRLKLEFKVQNSGETPIEFTAALHSYFEVVDCALPEARVVGLQGKRYLDKTPDPLNPVEREETEPSVLFGSALVDRMYLDAEPETILEVGNGAAVVVENTYGWRDVAIWNPHMTLPDFYKAR